jgi:hypothetical protein
MALPSPLEGFRPFDLERGGPKIANKRAKPDEIVAKPRQVELLMMQGMPELTKPDRSVLLNKAITVAKKKYGGMGHCAMGFGKLQLILLAWQMYQPLPNRTTHSHR